MEPAIHFQPCMPFKEINIMQTASPPYFPLLLGLLLLFCSSCAGLEIFSEDKPRDLFQEDNIVFLAQKNDFDQQVSSADGYLIVFFTDKECSSCKAFAEVFREAASTFSTYDGIRFVVFDTFYDRSSALELGVEGVPSTVILKKAEKIRLITGPVKRADLIEAIKEVINQKYNESS